MNGKLKRLAAMLAGLAVMIGASGMVFAETVPVSTATDTIVVSPEVHEESEIQEQTEVSTEIGAPEPSPTQVATEAPVQTPTAAPGVAPEAAPAQTAASGPTQLPVEGPTQPPTVEASQIPAETPVPTPSAVPENTPAQELVTEPTPVASTEAPAEPTKPTYVWIDAGAALFSQAGMGDGQRLGTLPDGAYAYLLEGNDPAACVALAVQTGEGQEVLASYVSLGALRPATAEEAQGTIAYADAWLKPARLEMPEAPEDANRPKFDFSVRVEIVNAAQSYRAGDQVTLRAVIEGEAVDPACQWQYDADDGWRDTDGNAEAFTFSIDGTNYTWKWRAVVYAGEANGADGQTSGT